MVDASIAANTGGVSVSSPPVSSPLIDEANKAAARIEAANAKMAELINKQEAMLARIALSGRAEAGAAAPIETEDEKYKREAKERYKGTGLDPTKGL